MPKIEIGNLPLSKVFLGNQEAEKIYLGDVLVYSKSVVPQLSAPVISLDNDTLTIEEVENAEYYDIYVDGVLADAIQIIEFGVLVLALEYRAINGMTWAEWVDSVFYDSRSGIFIEDGYVRATGGAVYYNSSLVEATDTIIANAIYSVSGGSND